MPDFKMGLYGAALEGGRLIAHTTPDVCKGMLQIYLSVSRLNLGKKQAEMRATSQYSNMG